MLLPAPGSGHQFVAAVFKDATDLVLLVADGPRDGLSVQFLQPGFPVEQVEAAGATVLKQEDDLFGAGSGVGESGCEGLKWVNVTVGLEGLQGE